MNRRLAPPAARCLRRHRTLLVGSGLDERSDGVLAAAAALARALDGRVAVLHAAELDPASIGVEAGWLEPGVYDDLAAAREKDLRAQIVRVGVEPERLHSLQVTFGNPERALLQAAAALGADLLVVGATRSGRAWTRAVGSTTAALVRRAPCPVLVARPPLRVPLRRVLAPVDLSMLASDSFRCGMHVLEQMVSREELRVDVLLVLRFLESDIAPQLRPPQVERLARVELDRFVEESRAGADVRCQAKLRVGAAAAEILEEVSEAGTDLVVIGTHGVGGFVPGSTGSVTQTVVRRAPCSVLVVPPIASLETAIAAAVQEQTAPL